MSWLTSTWGQLWPNLLADALWVPLAAWWAHSRVRRIAARHAALVESALRQHREELHLYLGDGPGRP
ncbi:hypothetical protein ACH4UM_19105 [Streptomyces sp. NPDC020801]|uniref:hypothetical protein n=1 Tax=Streptomyces sp. NPDC020801 TaxID=3365093 RepID=UPI00378DC65D